MWRAFPFHNVVVLMSVLPEELAPLDFSENQELFHAGKAMVDGFMKESAAVPAILDNAAMSTGLLTKCNVFRVANQTTIYNFQRQNTSSLEPLGHEIGELNIKCLQSHLYRNHLHQPCHRR